MSANSDRVAASAAMVNSTEDARFLKGPHRGGNEPAPLGRWILGRTGAIDIAECIELFAGHKPGSDAPLISGAATAEQRVAIGFALNFVAEDDVSALWAASDDDVRSEIEAAFEISVVATLDFAVENSFKVRVGEISSTASGVLAIDYFHTLKRLTPEPALHHHVFVVNYGVAPDGAAAMLDTDVLLATAGTLDEIAATTFRREMDERLPGIRTAS